MTTKISITLPDEEMEKIRKYCEENDVKISQIFRKSVRWCLDSYAFLEGKKDMVGEPNPKLHL